MRSREGINTIDNLFTVVFNKARSTVKGPIRSIPFSQRKLEISNKYLYWKLKVKCMQGKRIDKQRMLRYQELGKVVDNTMTIVQAKTQLQNAKKNGNNSKVMKWLAEKMNC